MEEENIEPGIKIYKRNRFIFFLFVFSGMFIVTSGDTAIYSFPIFLCVVFGYYGFKRYDRRQKDWEFVRRINEAYGDNKLDEIEDEKDLKQIQRG